MTTSYRRVQQGYLMYTIFGLAALVEVLAGFLYPEAQAALLVAACISMAFAWFFGRLSVELNEREAAVAFGPGLLKKRIDLAEVRAVRPVRNHWACGWGIRYIGGGWMWNVSGLDAVELEFRDGRRFRIGTDDPSGLARALEARLVQAA
ncbi:MAG: hypothetical protein HS116_23290 [Planctomycetes bacterium]|nr:hypothetical protein [Planctomycetota bacterium]